MPSRHDPVQSLADIVANAERVQDYLSGIDHTRFAADGMLRDAVERCLERLCEAAFRLGDVAETLMPGHSWRDVRGMGNQLRHAYDRISPDIIWNVAAHELPVLLADARGALARLQAEDGR